LPPLPKAAAITAAAPPPKGPELNEPAEFDPCLETLKVMNRLMAEFFNVDKSPAGGKKGAGTDGGSKSGKKADIVIAKGGPSSDT
jgi:hypothetical protein